MDNQGLYAFESWMNGSEVQTSGFYRGVEAMEFIDIHEESSTFAELHVYQFEEEALAHYESLQQ